MIKFAGFFGRVCAAYGIEPGRGAKAYIARSLSISDVAIGKWEKGEIPSLESLDKISNQTNASIHWLLTGNGPKEVHVPAPPVESLVAVNEGALISLIKTVVEEAARAGAVERWMVEGQAAREAKEDITLTETTAKESKTWLPDRTETKTKKRA